jgi:hypothetical protein
VRAPVIAVASLVLACAHAPTGAGPLWSLEDPLGDDHGDGDLTYPGRGEPSPGELDLVALRAFRERGGVVFEAVFARPVRPPDGRTVSSTGASLAEVAPLGFYTFNLDVYVDVDRIPGSGRTEALPGRKLAFDGAGAWDKVIALTPRPSEARSLLRGLWAREAKRALAGKPRSGREEEALEQRASDEVDRSVFFPTRVRVAGSSVRFFVPDSFFPGGAGAELAYAAVVTGADLELRLDVRNLLRRKDASIPGLFSLPIAPGHQLECFGGGRVEDPEQPPVVDLLADGKQEEVLLARPALVRPISPSAAASR